MKKIITRFFLPPIKGKYIETKGLRYTVDGVREDGAIMIEVTKD